MTRRLCFCYGPLAILGSLAACGVDMNGLADAGVGNNSTLGQAASSGGSTNFSGSSGSASSGANGGASSNSGVGAGAGASGSSSGGSVAAGGSGSGSSGSSGGTSSGSDAMTTSGAGDAASDDASGVDGVDTGGPPVVRLDASADASAQTAPPSDAAADAPPLSFANDVYPIVTLRCIACHTPGGAGAVQGHLDMTTGLAAGAFAALVNVKAMGIVAGGAGLTCAASALTRVVPGSSATSLLFDKVDSKLLGVQALCGNPMPNGAAEAPLTAAQVATIANWIDEGANP